MDSLKYFREKVGKELQKLDSTDKIDFEKIPAVIRRCPVCHALSLEYDPKTGRIYCTKCGFEEHMPVLE